MNDVASWEEMLRNLEAKQKRIRALEAKVEELGLEGQKLIDGIVHYRNLAISHGAKPTSFLNNSDRELCESYQGSKKIGDDADGWHDDAPEVWDDLDKVEAENRQLRELLAVESVDSSGLAERLRVGHLVRSKENIVIELEARVQAILSAGDELGRLLRSEWSSTDPEQPDFDEWWTKYEKSEEAALAAWERAKGESTHG